MTDEQHPGRVTVDGWGVFPLPSVDELTGREVVAGQKVLGSRQWDEPALEVGLALAYVAMRRRNPDMALDDFLAIPLGSFEFQEAETANGDRPLSPTPTGTGPSGEPTPGGTSST